MNATATCGKCGWFGVKARDLCNRCYQRAYRHDELHVRRSGRWGDPFVDEVVVLRAIEGRKPPMSSAERREAVRRLRERGWLLSRIADQLGIWQRQAQRDLAYLRGVRPWIKDSAA